MRVLIHHLPELGHLYPTLSLARSLRSRGHEVVYTVTFDVQPLIEAQGFRSVLVHPHVLPRGTLAGMETGLDWREILQRINEEYLSGAMTELVRRIDPDVVLGDLAYASPLLFAAHRLGIPCLQSSVMFGQRLDELPPLTSDLSPDASRLEREVARWHHSMLRLQGIPGLPPAHVSSLYDLLCACFGYPSEQLSFETVFSPMMTLYPEVIAPTSALDLPRRQSAPPLYAAIPPHLDREEEIPEAMAAFVDGRRPLIYAAMGSVSGRYPEILPFYRALIDTLRAHPDWQAILSVSRRFREHPIFGEVPDNLFLATHAPQLWCLNRASVFVTHAGIGSVREAVALQVPMVAVPQSVDQPGNAVRVAYHGLGAYLPPATLSAGQLGVAIEGVLREKEAFRERLKRMDEACRREEAEENGVAIVERAAQGRPHRGSRPSAPATERSLGAEAPPSLGWRLLAADGVEATGSVRRSDEGPLGLGAAGFVAFDDLIAALSAAQGPVLARLELSEDRRFEHSCLVGRVQRQRWTLDLSEELADYALWCAEQALAEEASRSPALVATLRALLDRYRALRGRAEPPTPQEIDPLRAHITMFSLSLRHRGGGAAGGAVRAEPHYAARHARHLAIVSLVLRRVGDAAGTAEGAELWARHYEAVRARFDAELQQRVERRIREAGLIAG